MEIERPTPSKIKEYLQRWDSLENYVLQESSLQKLFNKTYPKNDDMDNVLIKVCSLNDFYSTNIFSPFIVAKHIVELRIDDRLEKGDLRLVNEIAAVRINDYKKINFYSFATKYCSHHKPMFYPIFDSYVEKFLMHLKKKDCFCMFNKQELREYPSYKKILVCFQDFYKLTDFNLKELDKYLWQVGKEYFPQKY